MVAKGNDDKDTHGEIRQSHTTTSNDTSNTANDTSNTATGEGVPKVIRLNPAVMIDVPPLEGIDEIKIVYLQPVPFITRCTEGVAIHMLSSVFFAGAVFLAGFFLGSYH